MFNRFNNRSCRSVLAAAALLLAATNGAAGQWSAPDKVMASDAGGLDEFGVAVGVAGDAAIIGSHNDDDDEF